MVTTAMKQDASDLHIVPGSRPMMRISGALVPLEDEDVMSENVVNAIAEALMSPARKAQLDSRRDSVFAISFEDKFRMKVHAYYQEQMLALSLRLLRMTPQSLADLSAPSILERLAALKEGLIIISGRQDSGRTTLAASFLEHINRTRVCHIMTLEDPIEYQFLPNKSMISQREIGSDVPSFEDGLAAALKEDVDVLFVSESSSASLVRTALSCANAGQLVVLIMNTDSSVRCLEGIIASFPFDEQPSVRGLLADVLRGIVIQQLISKIGGGIAAVHEVFVTTAPMKAIIASNRFSQIDQTIKSGRADGMVSMDHEIANLVHLNRITLDTAREYARDQDTLMALIRI